MIRKNSILIKISGIKISSKAYLREIHETLRQRITVHYNYAGLDDKEVAEYILHKIKVAGASSTIINDAALAAANSYTQGNPRLIYNLMTDAFAIGAQQNRPTIDA